MLNLHKTYLTKHFIERMFLRFPEYCTRANLSLNDLMAGDINSRKGAAWKNLFLPLFNASQKNNTYINNTVALIKIYEKYGFDVVYHFYDNKEIGARIVICQRKNVFSVVTVMSFEKENGFRKMKQRQRAKTSTLLMTMGDVARSHLNEIKSQNNVQSVQKTLVWQNPGRIRDKNGYYCTEAEKFNTKGGLAESVKISYSALSKGIMDAVKRADANSVLVGEDGYFRLTVKFGGYEAMVRLVNLRVKESMSIDKLYQL